MVLNQHNMFWLEILCMQWVKWSPHTASECLPTGINREPSQLTLPIWWRSFGRCSQSLLWSPDSMCMSPSWSTDPVNFQSVNEAGCLVLRSGLRGVIIWRSVCVCLLVFHLCMHMSVSFSVSLPLASSTPSASCSTVSLPAPRRPLQRVQSWLRVNTRQNGHSLLVIAGRFF